PHLVERTLFLIGDAGVPDPDGDPVLTALAAAIAARAGTTTVVFLGDNIYPRGLPDAASPAFAEAARRLDAQLVAARGAGAVYLVPGNHDWARHGSDGWNAIRRQRRYVAERGFGAALWPADGCPGPHVLDLGTTLRLVLLDTQWWLHGEAKPGPGSDCPADTPEEVERALTVAVTGDTTRHVVVVGHHPLLASGSHGGVFSLRDHVFPLTRLVPWLWLPLPIVGSAYPVARQLGISDQDMAGPGNVRMRVALERAMRVRPPLAYAAGHEHALEVHRGAAARYVLVSGAGNYGHTTQVGRRAETLFAQRASGFLQMDFLVDGRTRLGVMVVDAGGRAREAWGLWLD
ncbi:MAG: metallophosphoesterase, partial [Gemmatimonadales bacterium]